MPSACFVDANVFVYASDPRDAEKRRRARAWRDHLWQEQRGRTSMQVVSETYRALCRLGGETPDEIWARVSRLFAWQPLAIGEPVLRRAREIEARWKISWWDSLIVAAAQLQDCELLLTEDLQDGMKFGSVTVRSPFTLEVREAQASYAALPRAASPHRPRGRPRRAVPA
jgi:predicted nucleic acid-binding protein